MRDGSYLNVNVFAPAFVSMPCPVLVWLCVGGNVVGYNGWPVYDGTALAGQGIVVVTVNGRLGAEGFTVLEDAPPNRAAMDWLAALEWVRREIANFGGDPGAVTVAGQSAGGGATAALLTSERARGLFQRAIVMSATTPSLDPQLAAETSREFVRGLGAPPTRLGLAKVPTPRLLDGIASQFGPAWRVSDPVQRIRNMLVGPPFRLVADPELDIGDVLEASRRGAGKDVAVLTGHTRHEFTAEFGRLDQYLDDDTLAAALTELGLADADQRGAYRQRYPEYSRGTLLGQAFTDRVFRLSSHRLAVARAAAGGTTFVYEFGPVPGHFQASHGVDVPLVFGTADSSPRRGDYQAWTHPDVQTAWAWFIKTGDPGWPAYDERHSMMRLSAPATGVEPDAMAWERSISA